MNQDEAIEAALEAIRPLEPESEPPAQSEAIQMAVTALDEAYDRLEEEGYVEDDDTVMEDIQIARSALRAIPPDDWMPIGDEHKNGEWFLCAWKNSIGLYGVPKTLYWHRRGCWTDVDPALIPVVSAAIEPTHCQPLPAPPKEPK